MLLSSYFLPLLKEEPAEAHVISHKLMLRAGLIKQTSFGIYAWLPLGVRVLRKIQKIVQKNQEDAGAIEVLMPTIQSAYLWQQSGRYDSYGQEMLKIQDRHGQSMLYGPTNEEMITKIFSQCARSYRDLPCCLFQVQWKFRDEIRPRFGVMRGREFLMKDGYSFDMTQKGAQQSYYKMFVAYLKTFQDLGVVVVPMWAATGPIGGTLSHEFILLSQSGESLVFCDRRFSDKSPLDDILDYQNHELMESIFLDYTNLYAATEETHNETNFLNEITHEEDRLRQRGIEVGHIFSFGTKYSKSLNLGILDRNGQSVYPYMGSYGIGISRLVGAIIESSNDSYGIIWPQEVAPFDIGIIDLVRDGFCVQLYKKLLKNAYDVLFDDTSVSAGEKFARMDLIGVPIQIIAGKKSMSRGEIEIKIRKTGVRQYFSIQDSQFFEKLVDFARCPF